MIGNRSAKREFSVCFDDELSRSVLFDMNFLATLYILSLSLSLSYALPIFPLFRSYCSFSFHFLISHGTRENTEKKEWRKDEIGANGWKFRALFFRGDNTRIVGEIRGDTGKIVDKLLTRYTGEHSRFNGRSKIIGKHASTPSPCSKAEKSSNIWTGAAPLSSAARKMPGCIRPFPGLSAENFRSWRGAKLRAMYIQRKIVFRAEKDLFELTWTRSKQLKTVEQKHGKIHFWCHFFFYFTEMEYYRRIDGRNLWNIEFDQIMVQTIIHNFRWKLYRRETGILSESLFNP